MRTLLISSTVALSLMLAAALAQPAVALPINIDSFEVGDYNVVDDSTTPTSTFGEQSALATTDVVGGVRLVRVLGNAPLGAATATAVLATVPVVDDSAALTVVAAPDGNANFEFTYDGIANGNSDGTSGALDLDLSAFTSIDVTLNASDVIGGVSVALSSSTQVRGATLPIVNGVLSFPLSGFTLDLSDIQAINVILTGIHTGETPLVTSIVAVPEPAAGLLVAAGLVGLAIKRRARQAVVLRSSTSS